MQYPMSVDITLLQDDFIEVEMLENIIDTKMLIKESIRAYCIQTVVLALVAAALFFTSWVAKESLYLVLFFWSLFTINFAYRYFFGYKNELKMTVEHLIVSNQNENNFFTEETGIINFNENDVEFLTNEQRRYFDYTLINNIKITKRLYIFVMKNSKEKNTRGFCYMIVPKRCLSDDQSKSVRELCQEITTKYSLQDWGEKTIFD